MKLNLQKVTTIGQLRHFPVEVTIFFASFYLLLPNILFLLTYTRLYISLPVSAFCLISLFCWAREIFSLKFNFRISNSKNYILPLILIFTWFSLSGIGGFGFQNTDYSFSNPTFSDMVKRPWPLKYAYNESEFYFAYYIGYFIFPSLIGKLTNWTSSNIFQFIWSGTGVFLAFILFTSFVKKLTGFSINMLQMVFITLVFMLGGGLDLIPWLFRFAGSTVPGDHIDFWARDYQYSSMTTLLYWVPQQCIAAWIATGILVNSEDKISKKYLGLPIASLVLYSPLALIGIIPLLLVYVYKLIQKNDFTSLLTVHNLVVATALFFITSSYILSNEFSFPMLFLFKNLRFFISYPIFIIVEFLFCVPLYFYIKRANLFSNDQISYFIPVILFLMLLPLFKFGIYNDLAMRGSIPALFVLFTYISSALLIISKSENTRINFSIKTISFLVLVISFASSASEITRGIKNYSVGASIWDQSKIKSFIDIPDKAAIEQRKGNANSFFFLNLAKLPNKQGPARLSLKR